jgi:hypothetical protein
VAVLDVLSSWSSQPLGFRVEDQNGYGVYVSNENTLNFNYGVNADSSGYLNYQGYQNGTTRFRTLVIADGKTNPIATFNGSTGVVALAGQMAVNGAVASSVTAITVTTGSTLYDGLSFRYSAGNPDLRIGLEQGTAYPWIGVNCSQQAGTNNQLYVNPGQLVSRIQFGVGAHPTLVFQTAAFGTAGSVIPWTKIMGLGITGIDLPQGIGLMGYSVGGLAITMVKVDALNNGHMIFGHSADYPLCLVQAASGSINSGSASMNGGLLWDSTNSWIVGYVNNVRYKFVGTAY